MKGQTHKNMPNVFGTWGYVAIFAKLKIAHRHQKSAVISHYYIKDISLVYVLKCHSLCKNVLQYLFIRYTELQIFFAGFTNDT